MRKKIVYKTPIFSSPIVLFLAGLFVLAFFLRFFLLWDNLFFGPEQGIDFAVIKQIAINHDFVLLGSKTDANGVFHGPIYYYLSVIPFLLSGGNPLVVIGFFVSINSLTVFLIYILGKGLFNKKVGVISAILFTFSFGSIVYSRWLSNPPLSIPLVTLWFILLYRFIQQKKKVDLFLSCLVFALIGQAEILNFVFLGGILFAIFISFRKSFLAVKLRVLLLAMLCLLTLSFSNYALFDIRNNFLISKSILKLFTQHNGYYLSWINALNNTSKMFFSSFSDFVLPAPFFVILPFFTIGVYRLLISRSKVRVGKTFLLLWLFIPSTILIVLRHAILTQFFVILSPVSIIFVAFVIDSFTVKNKKIAILLLCIVSVIHVFAYQKNVLSNSNIFFQSTQLDLKFSDQKKTIDTIYIAAGNKPFSFQSYTIPYWSQEGWGYLFWYYGEKRYGYAPVPEKAKLLYVIIQDDPSNKGFQEAWIRNTVSKWGKLYKEYRHGSINVQELHVI